MKKSCAAFCVVLLLNCSLWAQQPAGLPTESERNASHIISWATVLTAEALDVLASWRSENRGHALLMQGLRVGAVEGAVFGLKKAFPDARPCTPTHTCGSDSEMSGFPSGHTALACSTFGGPSISVTLPLAGATGLGRNFAGRHFWRQIGAGCLVGVLGSLIR